MRGFIGKILGYLGASHELHIKRNVVTYGICVIIATVLWFLNALNKEAGEHPEAAIDKVTTPGGCTIKGLNTMEQGG